MWRPAFDQSYFIAAAADNDEEENIQWLNSAQNVALRWAKG
jgi:hypothetical protein